MKINAIFRRAERVSIAEKLCELQQQVDEDRRYLGDLMIMLHHPLDEHISLEHDTWDGGYVMKRVRELIAENRRLKAQLAQISQADDATTDPQ